MTRLLPIKRGVSHQRELVTALGYLASLPPVCGRHDTRCPSRGARAAARFTMPAASRAGGTGMIRVRPEVIPMPRERELDVTQSPLAFFGAEARRAETSR